MDWNLAIEKNREALKRVLASLLAMAGLAIGQSPPLWGRCPAGQRGVSCAHLPHPPLSASPTSPPQGGRSAVITLPRRLHRAVLRLLRPAEAAARRLVIVAARGLVVPPPAPPRPRKPKPKSAILHNGIGTGIIVPRHLPHPEVRGEAEPRRTLCLPLLDPLPRWRRRRPAASGVPRISFPGFSAPSAVPVRRPPSPHDPVDAARLALRLTALASALDDLPKHARRFARWRTARDAAGAQNKENRGAGRFRRVSPLRPGRPPGWRRKPIHEVHGVLNDIHGLAFWALEAPDTS